MEKQINKIKYIPFILDLIAIFLYGLFYYAIDEKQTAIVVAILILVTLLFIKKLRFDINICFLVETFIVKLTLDQQIGNAEYVSTSIVMPILVYLFGKLFVAIPNLQKNNNEIVVKRYAVVGILLLTIGTFIHGLLNYKYSLNLGLIDKNYFTEFKDITIVVDRVTYNFNYIFICSLIIALVMMCVFYFAKKNNRTRILAITCTIAIVIIIIIRFLMWYVGTTRFLALQEGIHLMTTKHWGNFGLDLTYKNSTSNMWLDYGRDYGILVFGTLFIFFILSIKDAVLLVLNKNISVFTKSFLLCSFVLTNVYYFIDSRAYLYPCYWYVGLIICGMLSEASHISKEK